MRDAIKIGVIADQTGALSIMGGAQANVATLVVDETNAGGGLLGRRLELLIEDSATDDAQAAAAATKRVREDHVDVLLGGIFSSTREAIKKPAVVEGETLYIYPEQYEGQEYHPLLFCTGAVVGPQRRPRRHDGDPQRGLMRLSRRLHGSRVRSRWAQGRSRSPASPARHRGRACSLGPTRPGPVQRLP